MSFVRGDVLRCGSDMDLAFLTSNVNIFILGPLFQVLCQRLRSALLCDGLHPPL